MEKGTVLHLNRGVTIVDSIVNEQDSQTSIDFELSITIGEVGSTIDLTNSSSTYVCFPLFDKNLSNFEQKDYLLMSLKLREATRRIQSVVK